MKQTTSTFTIKTVGTWNVELCGLDAMGIPASWYMNKRILIRPDHEQHMLKGHPDDLPTVLRKIQQCPDLLDDPLAYGRHEKTGSDPEFEDRFEAFYDIDGQKYVLVFMCPFPESKCIYLSHCYAYDNYEFRTNKKVAARQCVKVR